MRNCPFVLLTLALVGIVGCAPGPHLPSPNGTAQTSAAPSAMKVTGVIGRPTSLNRVTITVDSADLNYVSQEALAEPGPGDRLVVVDIEILNSGSSAIKNYQFSLPKLVDDAGRIYPRTVSAVKPDLVDVPDSLAPRDKARGFVTFAIPVKATGLALRYSIYASDHTLTEDTLTVPLG